MKRIKEIFISIINSLKDQGINLYGKYQDQKLRPQDKEKAMFISTLSVLTGELVKYGYGVSRTGNKVYIYNGEYWQEVKKDDMRLMLRDVALAVKVPSRISRYHENTDIMYKQMLADADKLNSEGRDAETAYINCANGTVHIKNGVHTLHSFDKADGLTYKLGYDYEPEAQAPKFRKFLDQVLPDKSLQKVVAEYAAYALADKKKRQKVMFFYGKGANGKGTLIEIISAALGRENVVERSCESLCDEGSRTVADLEGKLLNVCAEMGKKVNITNFKMLASGDPIMARRLYGEPYTIIKYAKLLFSCNELPRNIEHTYAYFRRLILVPFEHTVKDGEMNHTLGEEIIAEELPEVLNWILEGYERLSKQDCFTESRESKKVLENYTVSSDAVASFLDDMNYRPMPVGSGEEITLAEFYKRYDIYCMTNHFHVHNSRTFSARIRAFGYQYKRKSDCYHVYVGKQSGMEEERDKIRSLWDNDTMGSGVETGCVTIVDVQPDKPENDNDNNTNVEV